MNGSQGCWIYFAEDAVGANISASWALKCTLWISIQNSTPLSAQTFWNGMSSNSHQGFLTWWWPALLARNSVLQKLEVPEIWAKGTDWCCALSKLWNIFSRPSGCWRIPGTSWSIAPTCKESLLWTSIIACFLIGGTERGQECVGVCTFYPSSPGLVMAIVVM